MHQAKPPSTKLNKLLIVKEVRDILLDAPFWDLGSSHQFNPSNSFYASTNYTKSEDDSEIKAQIDASNKLESKTLGCTR